MPIVNHLIFLPQRTEYRLTNNSEALGPPYKVSPNTQPFSIPHSILIGQLPVGSTFKPAHNQRWTSFPSTSEDENLKPLAGRKRPAQGNDIRDRPAKLSRHPTNPLPQSLEEKIDRISISWQTLLRRSWLHHHEKWLYVLRGTIAATSSTASPDSTWKATGFRCLNSANTRVQRKSVSFLSTDRPS